MVGIEEEMRIVFGAVETGQRMVGIVLLVVESGLLGVEISCDHREPLREDHYLVLAPEVLLLLWVD